MTQLYPAVLDPKTLTRQVWDVSGARRIPGVGRALDLISGLIGQMPLDAYAGIMPLDRPPLLENPDLDLVRPLFVGMQVEDWLLHGNAAHLVTVRSRRTGWPAAVKWYPATAWHVAQDADDGRIRWWLHGREVPTGDVVHVQNGADPMAPYRGMGVVERYLRTFDRVALQEEREREDMRGGSVPSVAVVTPQTAAELDEEAADEAATAWERKFGGGARRPAILPNGTTVTPLGWSPHDGEANEARKLALTDVANIFNLDAYWLGAPSSSHTYRSPGPLFLMLVRTTLERVLSPLEEAWSLAWLPRGQKVTFDRQRVLGDDLANTISTLTKATGGPVMTTNEARTVLKLGPVDGGDELRPAPATNEPDVETDDPPTTDPDPTDPETDQPEPEEGAA